MEHFVVIEIVFASLWNQFCRNLFITIYVPLLYPWGDLGHFFLSFLYNFLI